MRVKRFKGEEGLEGGKEKMDKLIEWHLRNVSFKQKWKKQTNEQTN
jgi:hypothetical protein